MQSLPVPRSIVGESLYNVASDPLVWAQHPSPMRYQKAMPTMLPIDRDSVLVLGSTQFLPIGEYK